MKYLSIDIETSGLEPKIHSTLQIAAIIEDTSKKRTFDKLPKIDMLIDNAVITGSSYALSMHPELLLEISKRKPTKRMLVPHYKATEAFIDWLLVDEDFRPSPGISSFQQLKDSGKKIVLNVAGKNFGTFDKLFLEELPYWKNYIVFSQRIIDPAILYWDPTKDERLPNMDTCKERAKIKGVVAHTALEDAWDVIQLLRVKFKGK